MPCACSVANCLSYGAASNAICPMPVPISFHRFPKTRELRIRWIHFCKRTEPLKQSSRVCSLHFSPDSYEKRFIRHSGIITRQRLKQHAVPNRNGPSNAHDVPTHVRSDVAASWKGERRSIVEQLLKEPSATVRMAGRRVGQHVTAASSSDRGDPDGPARWVYRPPGHAPDRLAGDGADCQRNSHADSQPEHDAKPASKVNLESVMPTLRDILLETRVEPLALGRGERVKHRTLLDLCEMNDDDAEEVTRRLRPASAPLDPERRAAIVQQAIADMEKREKRKQILEKARAKFRMSQSAALEREKAGGGPDGAGQEPPTEEDAKPDWWEDEWNEVLAETRRRRRPPPSSSSEDDDELDMGGEWLPTAPDGLEMQLKVMLRMQSRIHALSRRLAGRRQRLREVADTFTATISALDQKRGLNLHLRKNARSVMRPGEQEALNIAGPGMVEEDDWRRLRTACADPLLVLRSEMDADMALRDLPPGNDLLGIPTDMTSAVRIIFDLRLEVLALRTRLLQRAFRETSMRIEMTEVNVEHARTEISWMDSLDAVFTPAQKARLRPGSTNISWDRQDYLKAIALRFVCRRRTFDYVRNTMKIPLPSMYSCRAVAAFGRFPDVTERYKELNESKKLRFDWKNQPTAVESEDSEPEPQVTIVDDTMDPNDIIMALDVEKPAARGRGRGRGRPRGSTGRPRGRPPGTGRGVKRMADGDAARGLDGRPSGWDWRGANSDSESPSDGGQASADYSGYAMQPDQLPQGRGRAWPHEDARGEKWPDRPGY